MGFSYNVNVLNQKGSPAIYTDTFANRPAPGFVGRLFIANDTSAIYEDIGTAWVLIANVSSGAGTLQQVTTNGNTSNVGISVTAGGISSNTLTITSLTPGSVAFVGTADLITEDNANLFFDNTNNRLGIGTNTPGNVLDLHSALTTAILALNNTAGNQSLISFLNTSVAKWRIGNSSTNTFDILNVTLATNAISINSANNNTYFSGFVGINQSAPSYNLDVNGITNLGGVTNIQTGNNLFYLQNNGATTGWTANKAQNTSGSFIFGLNGSASGGISTGATAYATVINSLKNLELYSGGVKRLTLDETTGNATLTATLSINNANGNFSKLDIAGNGSSLTNVSSIQFYDNNSGASRNFAWSNGAGGNTSNLFGKFILSASTAVDLNALIGNPLMAITGIAGNLLLGSLTDDTVNKLQVSGSVKSTSNYTNNGLVSCLNATPTTLFTITTYGLYTFYVDLPDGGSAPITYSSYAIIIFDGTTARIMQQTNGAQLVLTLSGNSLQATQTAGSTFNVRYVYQKLGY